MSDLSALLDALGPEPPPAPGPASFFTILASNVLGMCTTDPAAIRDRVAGLLEAEGWRLADRTADCCAGDGAPALLAPPGPDEVVFLARTPASAARLAGFAKAMPPGYPAGIPYVPVTPAAVLVGRTNTLIIKAPEGAPDDLAGFVRKEREAQADAFQSAGDAYALWAPLFAAQGWALADWTGRIRAGGTHPLAERECAFVGCVPGAEADFEEFLCSLSTERDLGLLLRPLAAIVGRTVRLHLADYYLASEAGRVEAFVRADGRREPEVVRQKLLEALRGGWRLTDRTAECRPDDADPLRLAPAGDGELVFLAYSPQSAPLFAAVAAVRPTRLPEEATYVQAAPLALLINRARCARLSSEEDTEAALRDLLGDAVTSSGSGSGEDDTDIAADTGSAADTDSIADTDTGSGSGEDSAGAGGSQRTG